MTKGVPRGTNLGNLLQYGDYMVQSPSGAWSGAGGHVHVRVAEVAGGRTCQYGGDVGSPEGFERVFDNGIWGDWAASGSAAVPTEQSTAPTITSLAPTSISDDGASHDVVLTGTGYVRGSVVYVNNDAATTGATTFTSATSLTRAVNTGHATIVGPTVVSFQVVNPDGKRSNAALLTVS